MAVGKTRKKLNAKASRSSGGGAPSGPAGGDLTGTYPNPTILNLQGIPFSAPAPTIGDVLYFNGTDWIPNNLSSTTPVATGDLATTTVYENRYYALVASPTPFPTGVNSIILKATETGLGNSGALYPEGVCFSTILNTWVPCIYDVTNNTIIISVKNYKVTLDATQITILPTRPVKVINSFGTGTFISMTKVSYVYKGHTPYDNSKMFALNMNGGNPIFADIFFAALFQQGSNVCYQLFAQQFGGIYDIQEDQAVYAYDPISSTDSTVGDGVLDIYIDFEVLFV